MTGLVGEIRVMPGLRPADSTVLAWPVPLYPATKKKVGSLPPPCPSPMLVVSKRLRGIASQSAVRAALATFRGIKIASPDLLLPPKADLLQPYVSLSP